MDSLLEVVNELGVDANGMSVLSDHATTVIALLGTGFVARIHKPISGEPSDTGRPILVREQQLGLHLAQSGVAATRPVEGFGVVAIDDTWMTLWHREDFEDEVVTGQQLGSSLVELERGMSSFPHELPRMVAWNSAGRLAAQRALTQTNERLLFVAKAFGEFDELIDAAEFLPAHADSHPGNLMKTSRGWIWIDLGDTELMPKHWDLATAVTRSVVLGSHVKESQEAVRTYSQLTGRVITADDVLLPLLARSIQETLICWDMGDDAALVELRIENTAQALREPHVVVDRLFAALR